MTEGDITPNVKASLQSTGFRPFSREMLDRNIPLLFEAQARRAPESLAAKGDGRALTYAALNAAANRVAHAILKDGSAAAAPVALLLDQGLASITAILGVLKVGKIYVALEPTADASELSRLLKDCQPEALLTSRNRLAKAQSLTKDRLPCLCLEDLPGDLPAQNPGVEIAPDQPAYIFYTSGSTGKPKGVVDSHRNVLHNVMRYSNSLEIAPDDRLSMIQSCAFSGTVSSLFSALLNGAAIFPFDLQNHGIAPMVDWIAAEEITIFHSVPMIFGRLMERGPALPSLRLIRLEGDQAQGRHARLFQRHFRPGCRLVNGLGTTETGLVRQFFLAPDEPFEGALLPVGGPVQDMRVCLLNDAGQTVEQGQIGRMAVHSRYLALGYWQRPDLTEAAFIADPEDPAGRIYLSNDLGRIRDDATLEHLGRQDFQIKIRGRSVAVADCEEALLTLPGIAEAAVKGWESGAGREQLIAYLVLQPGAALTISGLRRALAGKLVDHQIPGRVVFLEHLPQDRNGKLDRKSLPSPGRERPALDQPYRAPSSPLEEVLAACFRECLDIDRIGTRDDFFDLGGDSLAATELMLAVEAATGMSCPAEIFFDEPSVAAIATALSRQDPAHHLVPLRSGGESAPLFLFHNLPGHLLEYRPLISTLATGCPIYGLQNMTSEEGSAASSLPDMVSGYLNEIRALQPEGPYYLAGNCFGGMLAFEAARQLRAQGQSVALVALLDTAYFGGPLDRLRQSLALAKHWRNLTRLKGRSRLHYLWKLGSAAAAKLKRGDHGSSEAIPDLTLERNRRAQLSYRPGAYDGPIVVIYPGEPYNQLGWTKLASQDSQVIGLQVADSGLARPHLLQAPQSDDLAKFMSTLLSAGNGSAKPED